MCRQEGIDHALSIAERDSTLIVLPINSSVGRIGPYEIVEQPVIWYICWTLDTPDIVHRFQARAQTAMNAEDLAGDNGSDR